jgi:transcriptional regulator with XRE-family HTH domain
MLIMETRTRRQSKNGVARTRLREFRLRADLTQSEIADLLRVKQSTVSVAEKTGKGLGEDKWEQLAKLFGTDVLTLRGWAKIYA